MVVFPLQIGVHQVFQLRGGNPINPAKFVDNTLIHLARISQRPVGQLNTHRRHVQKGSPIGGVFLTSAMGCGEDNLPEAEDYVSDRSRVIASEDKNSSSGNVSPQVIVPATVREVPSPSFGFDPSSAILTNPALTGGLCSLELTLVCRNPAWDADGVLVGCGALPLEEFSLTVKTADVLRLEGTLSDTNIFSRSADSLVWIVDHPCDTSDPTGQIPAIPLELTVISSQGTSLTLTSQLNIAIVD